MTQLRKNYLPYYYTKNARGKEEQRTFLNKQMYQAPGPGGIVNIWPYGPNGEFPVIRHDNRGFLPKKGKKRNMTHSRIKRRLKARRRAA